MTGFPIAPGLSLPLDIATKRNGLFGTPGAGKSNLARVIAEGLFKNRVPLAIIDPEGSWWGMRSAFDGKGPGLPIPIFGGDHADVPLEETGGALMADLIVGDRLSCIVDLELFSGRERAHFLADMGERLIRKNKDPLHLILEEADEYVPQRFYKGQERMVGAWTTIVGRGRKKGMGCTAISTRPAKMSTDVRNLLDNLFVMRTTGPHDRKAILEWVKHKSLDPALVDSLPGLDDGEAWLWSPQWLKVFKRVKCNRQWTFDSGATPQLRAKRKAATLADVNLGEVRVRMAATIEKAKAEDPRELRRKVADLEAKLRAAAAPVARPEAVVKVREVKVSAKAELAAIRKSEAGIMAAERDLARSVADLRTAAEAIGKMLAQLEGQSALMNYGKRTNLIAGPGEFGRTDSIAWSSRRGPLTVAEIVVVPDNGSGGRFVGMIPDSLGKGEARILTALAQHAGGCTREQITVLTGYKRSSRDTYLQRLKAGGATVEKNGRVYATPGGAAIVADVDPLPTGPELARYWLDKLPAGESKILGILLGAYPGGVDRDALTEATGYKRSSRDTYLQRLGARELVQASGRDVRASDTLF